MNKSTMALNAAYSLLNLISRDKAWHTDVVDVVLATIEDALEEERKPRVVERRSTWTNSAKYSCSNCGEEFRSEHRANYHCKHECNTQDLTLTQIASNTKPSWVELTDNDIIDALGFGKLLPIRGVSEELAIARAVLAKSKEKNT